MDDEIERRLVQSYIRKGRRERLLYELTNPKKRYDGLSRFCHQADDLLDKRTILMSGRNLYRQRDFIDFIAHNEEPCVVLSPYFSQDEPVPTQNAVEFAATFPDVCIIMGSHFAVVQTEAGRNGQDKYLLSDGKAAGKRTE